MEFDLGDCCIGVCFCQNSWTCVHLKLACFILCKLYLHKFDLEGKISQGREEEIRGEYQPEWGGCRAERLEGPALTGLWLWL